MYGIQEIEDEIEKLVDSGKPILVYVERKGEKKTRVVYYSRGSYREQVVDRNFEDELEYLVGKTRGEPCEVGDDRAIILRGSIGFDEREKILEVFRKNDVRLSEGFVEGLLETPQEIKPRPPVRGKLGEELGHALYSPKLKIEGQEPAGIEVDLALVIRYGEIPIPVLRIASLGEIHEFLKSPLFGEEVKKSVLELVKKIFESEEE